MESTLSPRRVSVIPADVPPHPSSSSLDTAHIGSAEQPPPPGRARYVQGILMLAGVVALWVASGMLIQEIFSDFHFDSPFFLTYFSTSLFTFYLPCYYLAQRWTHRHAQHTQRKTTDVDALQSNGVTLKQGKRLETQVLLSDASSSSSQHHTAALPWKVAAILCPLWFTLNYTYNVALSMTSISSATILSSSSSLFVLVFSRLLLKQRVTPATNLVGVACTVAGAVMISWRIGATGASHADSLSGDMLATVSAMAYGLYSVTLKHTIPAEKEEEIPTLLVFGCIGLINLCTLWPLFPLLHFTGIEPLELPSLYILAALLLNGIFGTVISDYMWARSVLLTSPLIATIGLSWTSPIAMLADAVFNHRTFTGLYLVGTGFMLAGFFAVNLSHAKQSIDIDNCKAEYSSVEGSLHVSKVSGLANDDAMTHNNV